MKKLILFLGLCLWATPLKAQVNMDNFIMRRDAAVVAARTKAIEDAKKPKPQQYIVAGAKDGILRYILRDGKRTEFALPQEPQKVYCVPWWDEWLPKKDSTAAQNALAVLVDELSAQGWMLVVCSGSEGEVYQFSKDRVEDKKEKRP